MNYYLWFTLQFCLYYKQLKSFCLKRNAKIRQHKDEVNENRREKKGNL